MKPTQSLSLVDQAELPLPLTSGLLFCFLAAAAAMIAPSFTPSLAEQDKWEVKKASFCYSTQRLSNTLEILYIVLSDWEMGKSSFWSLNVFVTAAVS